MKKIIPFKKDIIFKTNVSEITSISLEHTLHIEENQTMKGEFIVSGEYKITDTSINVEPFSYQLPFDITIDEKYIIDKASIDINDFYYEIINENVLSVNIEVVIDPIEERLLPKEPIIEEKEEPVVERIEVPIEAPNVEMERSLEDEIEKNMEEEMAEIEPISLEENVQEIQRCIEEEEPPRIREEMNEKIGSLFDHMDESLETYQSYKVYIVREGDTIETVLEKYSITKEEIEAYNDLREWKIGDKIIIPCVN